MRSIHHMPFGAELLEGGEARFRLWAPAAKRVDLCIEGHAPQQPTQMRGLSDGWFGLELDDIRPGTRYRYLIDSKTRVPDPASRFQPDDVQGPSEIVDPLAFEWTDDAWRGRPWEEAVTYELHVGAFTKAGTFESMIEKFDHLVDVGVTAIELMPLAEVPGRRNWGYDGVLPFAPESAFGSPNGLKTMIDMAHQRGLMVFVDVVYNHFGPEGNYLWLYAPQFFTERHHTPWGAAVNFDGGCRPVRDFFIHNALYWLEEYHIDGLRFDAVHAIIDDSTPDILTELADTVRARMPTGRHIHLVLENDDNTPRHLERRPDNRPRRYTAQWNDDAHHAFHVLITGENEGYYSDYRDSPIRDLGRALTEGFAYQGESSPHRDGEPRGAPSAHLPPTAFVDFLQNHDQIGNRAFGERLAQIVAPEALRAAAAVLLLSPQPPLLFMGEEWGAKTPFPFFCDFQDELADKVREGRRREFARFPEFQDPKARERIPDPNDPATFAMAVLDWSEPQTPEGRQWLAFYREWLHLRQAEIVPRLADIPGKSGKFQIHGERGLSAAWTVNDGSRLCLYANLGPQPLDKAPVATHGRVIATVGDGMAKALATGCWPAWSVAWLIGHGVDGHER
jgi:malto-oligosyltrehalose trehalohydrolase